MAPACVVGEVITLFRLLVRHGLVDAVEGCPTNGPSSIRVRPYHAPSGDAALLGAGASAAVFV
jgi:hypothetical protein